MPDPIDVIGNRIDEISKHAAAVTRRAKVQAEFSELDCDKITALSDKELAAWQANFAQDTPQWRFAEHAWQSKLIVQQVKAQRFAAYVGLVGIILGAFLGAYLVKPAVEPEAKHSANTNTHAKNQNQMLEPQKLPSAPVEPRQLSSGQNQPNAKN